MHDRAPRFRKGAWLAVFVLLAVSAGSAAERIWSDVHRPASAGVETAPRQLADEEMVIAAVEKNAPAVVSILVRQKAVLGDDAPEIWVETGEGTGFLVSPDGLIVTNRHVVQDRAFRHTVFLDDGRQFEAGVIDIDPVNDLALLKIGGTGFAHAELVEDGAFRLGQTVIAIGNALGKFDNTVTRGILSGIGRSIEAADFATGRVEQLEGVLQTDAAVNSGNSGGPLIDLRGKVIGVNTAVERYAQGLGFAIPASEVRKVLSSYRAYGVIARPRLGIRYFAITPDLAELEGLAHSNGAWVRSGEQGETAVLPGSPAFEAGLKDGDIILAVDGEDVSGKRSLAGIIGDKKVGDRVTLKVARGGDILFLTASLDAHPPFRP